MKTIKIDGVGLNPEAVAQMSEAEFVSSEGIKVLFPNKDEKYLKKVYNECVPKKAKPIPEVVKKEEPKP